MATIWQGSDARIDFTTRDNTGALFDATTISVVIEAPDLTETAQTLAGGGVTRVSLGTYYFVVRATLPSDATTGAGYLCSILATVGGLQRVEVKGFAVSKDPTS